MCEELTQLTDARLKAIYDFNVLLTPSNAANLLRACKETKAAEREHLAMCEECRNARYRPKTGMLRRL